MKHIDELKIQRTQKQGTEATDGNKQSQTWPLAYCLLSKFTCYKANIPSKLYTEGYLFFVFIYSFSEEGGIPFKNNLMILL